MKAELMISELALDMKAGRDKKYIYGSLFDFYADTKEGLKKLTNIMYDKDLFIFLNIGRYAGIDEKTNRLYTFEDGEPDTDWLLRLASVIQEMNNNGDNITITISKKYLIDNHTIKDMTLENIDATKNVEGLIDLYVYHLKNILDQAGYRDLLKTQVRGKLSKNILSKLEGSLIVLG